VLYALKRAVRLESEAAVIYWWGVGADTARKWRRATGVPARLRRRHGFNELGTAPSPPALRTGAAELLKGR
jgi:hypothetical protein